MRMPVTASDINSREKEILLTGGRATKKLARGI
jgi:hypothetical protein